MDRRRKLKKEELSDFPYQMVEKVTANVEEYEKFLDFYSRFYKYNIANALMIYGQNPDASAVGTYEQWKSKAIERGVRKGAFPIKIQQGQTLETAFDIADTYGRAFTYRNSYTLTEKEKEQLVSALGLSDEEGSFDERIMKFAIKQTMEKAQQLFYENANFKSHFTNYTKIIGYSAIQLIKSRYNLAYTASVDEEDLAIFRNIAAFTKINILQYIQPTVRNAILEIDKGIAQITKKQEKVKERTDTYGTTGEFYTRGGAEAQGNVRSGQTENGRGYDSGGGNADSRALRGFGNRPRQMGLDVGGMDDRVSSGQSGRVDAGAEIRYNSNSGKQRNRGVSGDSGEELEREISPSDERELSGTGAVRGRGEDVSRELSDARGERQTVPSEINEREENTAEIVRTRKLTPAVKWQENLTAIIMLKELERTGRQATDEEREVLKQFSGFGSLPQVFDENNERWAEQREQMKALLTKEEYDSLEESTLSAHYTSPEIIQAMYTALEQFGVRGGNILEITRPILIQRNLRKTA